MTKVCRLILSNVIQCDVQQWHIYVKGGHTGEWILGWKRLVSVGEHESRARKEMTSAVKHVTATGLWVDELSV